MQAVEHGDVGHAEQLGRAVQDEHVGGDDPQQSQSRRSLPRGGQPVGGVIPCVDGPWGSRRFAQDGGGRVRSCVRPVSAAS